MTQQGPGLKDLLGRQQSALLEAERSFLSDALRLLQVPSWAARLGAGCECECRAAAYLCRLDCCAHARIWAGLCMRYNDPALPDADVLLLMI